MSNFRRSLLAAARDACQAGDITACDCRAIRRATWRPLVLARLHNQVVEDAAMTGVVTAVQATNPEEIDWDGFLDFLKDLLPMILEFIKALMLLF